MSAATSSINTPERPGNFVQLLVATGAICYLGTLVARDSSGTAVPAADTAGLRVIGRAEHEASAGDPVKIRKAIFRFANSATNAITAAMIGKLAFVEDDSTVASTSTNRIVAGRIFDVDTDGVWIDTRDIPVAAIPAAASTNGTAAAAAPAAATSTDGVAAAASASLADLAAEAEKIGDDARATRTATGVIAAEAEKIGDDVRAAITALAS